MDSTKPPIIVTGSEGLIGKRLCERLSRQYSIAGLDICEPKEPTPGVEWFYCDFTDDQSVEEAIVAVRQRFGAHITSVVHLAAYSDLAGGDSSLYDQLTVQGTRRLLQALRKLERVEQFVFSSSLLVMKPCDTGEELTESSPTQAEWEYPQSKLEAEEMIRNEQGTIPAISLRLAGVYDEWGHSLPICQNIRRIAEKEMESYFFPGDAEHGQAFVHLEDLVKSFEHAIQRRGSLGRYESFLIAEDECLSYKRLQDIIGELVHGADDWPTMRIPKLLAKAGAWAKDTMADSEEERPFIKPWMVDLADAHYPVDASLAVSRLDWSPRHRLSDTLPTIIAHLKQDPQRWYEVNNLPLPDDPNTLDAIAAAK